MKNPALKATAVKMLKDGIRPRIVALKTGAHPATLRRWVREEEGREAPAPKPKKVAPSQPVTAPPAAPAPVASPPPPAGALVPVPTPDMAAAGLVTPLPPADLQAVRAEEELRELLAAYRETREDAIVGAAEMAGLPKDDPFVKRVAAPSKIGMIGLKRGGAIVANQTAKVPPWLWLIVGGLAEGLSLFLAIRALRQERIRRLEEWAKSHPVPVIPAPQAQ